MTTTPQQQIIEIPLEDLHDSPFQPRTTYTGLEGLAAAITAEGRIHQALLVRPRIGPLFGNDPDAAAGYEIVYGHRRRRAAELAGLATAPCTVRAMSDAEVRSAQMVENVQRENMTALDEGAGFQAQVDAGDATADQIAERIGKSRSYVYGRMKLVNLVGPAREALLSGKVGSEVSLLVARHPVAIQPKILAAIAADTSSSSDMSDGGKRSYRHIRDLIADKFTLQIKAAIFDPEDLQLQPKAGACSACPKRSGNAPEFADLTDKHREGEHRHYTRQGGADICTDPECFAAKKTAHLAREAAALQAKGEIVVTGNKARQAVDAHGRLKDGYMAVKDAKALLKTAAKAGTAAPAIVSVQDQRTGVITKAVRVADLATAGVKVADKKPKSAGYDHAAERREMVQKMDAEVAHRTELHKRVRPLMLQAEPSTAELRMIIQLVLTRVDHDTETRVLHLYGIKGGYGVNVAPLLEPLTADQLRHLLLDLVLDRWADVEGPYNVYDGRDELHAIARHYGVDPDTISTPSLAGAGAKLSEGETQGPKAGVDAEAEQPSSAGAVEIEKVEAGFAGKGMAAAWPFPKQAYA